MDTKGLIIRDKDTATHLLPNEDFLAFKRNMGKLINNTIKRSSNISEQKLPGAMGFPNNWSKITGYKK